MNKPLFLIATLLLVGHAAARNPDDSARVVIESGGRSVTLTEDVPRENTGYDSPWHFSHAIRAGDFVYISGVIISARQGESLPMTRERFRERTEEIFEMIQKSLESADASLEGMVKINTFHVLDGKTTDLRIDEQALVIAETKAKYAVEPHPAWTAVGTSGLFAPRGIVEIELVVYAPRN